MQIAEILKRKFGQPSRIVTVRAEAPVSEVVGLLAEHGIGALVVSDDGMHLDGIISERDVVRRLHDDPDVLSRPVADIMTVEVATCTPDSTLDEVMAVMTEGRFRHVPVVVDGKLAGIVSIGDAVKHKVDELQFERDQLAGYVVGT